MNFSFLSGRVAVVGSRDFPSPLLVSEFVRSLPSGCVVVSGGSGVVDLEAAASARARGLEVEEFLADWKSFGRSAGPLRNRALVSSGLSFLVCFLSDPSSPSRGSASAVREARKAGVPVFLFGPEGPLN